MTLTLDGDGFTNKTVTLQKTLSTYSSSYDETFGQFYDCLLYTSPSPRDRTRSRMPSSA